MRAEPDLVMGPRRPLEGIGQATPWQAQQRAFLAHPWGSVGFPCLPVPGDVDYTWIGVGQ